MESDYGSLEFVKDIAPVGRAHTIQLTLSVFMHTGALFLSPLTEPVGAGESLRDTKI